MLVIKHKDCAIRLNAIFYYDNTNKILCQHDSNYEEQKGILNLHTELYRSRKETKLVAMKMKENDNLRLLQ